MPPARRTPRRTDPPVVPPRLETRRATCRRPRPGRPYRRDRSRRPSRTREGRRLHQPLPRIVVLPDRFVGRQGLLAPNHSTMQHAGQSPALPAQPFTRWEILATVNELHALMTLVTGE